MIKKVSFALPDFSGKEDVLIVPIFKGTSVSRGILRKLDILCASIIDKYLKQIMFTPDMGETLLLGINRDGAPKNLIFMGLGDKASFSTSKFMQAAGNAAKLAKKGRFETCHFLCAGNPDRMTLAEFLVLFIKGFSLALYTFSRKSDIKKEKSVEELVIYTSKDKRSLRKTVQKTLLVIEHTGEVRDMVNAPSNEFTPSKMAAKARSLAKKHNVHCRVLGIGDIKRQKMGAIAAVSKGSVKEPKLIVLHHNRHRPRLPVICLVGKGVTFDSGGISLKPWEHMEEMKGDMAGGAVVINAVAAAARLNIPAQVVGIIPCVENMPGQRALKPGDVISTYSGKTIEVLSTDAEGRLILSDAISYAASYEPKAIIDFATLTGACVIALGKSIAGVLGNNQILINMLLNEAKSAHENLWQLPLDDEFYERVKGDIADYKNFSGRDGSTSSAAALLGSFAGDIPWAHIDIAGTFWSDSGSVSWKPKGGTGFGIDLALRILESLASRRMLQRL